MTGQVNEHWLPGFNFNVEEWTEGGKDIERTIAICSTVWAANAVFNAAIREKPAGWYMIRNRTRAMRRYPPENW